MKAEQAWQAATGQLQLEMPKPVFDTWVSEADLIAYEDGEFIIGVPNAYARDWLENRLSSTVTRLLTGIMNRAVCVRFAVWQNGNTPGKQLDVELPLFF
jgi:chromosomal replication initiator protein